MKYGYIFQYWAIIVELDDSDGIRDILRKSGTNYFIKDWRKEINMRVLTKNFMISEKKYFQKLLTNFDNEQEDNDRAIWEIELKKISQYGEIYDFGFIPMVSVILASYNSSKTIENSIKSIIKQSYKNIELIVIDDCSTDDSYDKILEIKKKYENRLSGFKLFKNNKNMGAYYSRNYGIYNCNGSIVAIQDADDISDIKRLTISIYELLNNDVEFVLANGPKLENLCQLCPIIVAMASLVVRRDFFKKYGMYDDESRHSADLEILDRAYFLKYGKYEYDNFWYWLNYTDYIPKFYKHLYENLYYVGEENDSITKQNNIKKRILYLNERRKIMKNKI